MLVTVTDTAWDYLKDLPPHKQRKPVVQFDGKHFVTLTSRTSAKGLSTHLINFILRPPISQFDTSNYSKTPPHYILPSSFLDARPSDIIEMDYAFLQPGEPLSTLPNELLYGLIYKPTETEYTHWSDLSPADRHSIVFPKALLSPVGDIVDYWHISSLSGRLPRSPVEKFGAFLNAIGLRYLDHVLLHPPASADTPYKSLDRQIEKMKEAAARRKAKYNA